MTASVAFAQGGKRFDTVHAWHRNINQIGIKTLQSGQTHGFMPVLGHDRAHAVAFQHGLQNHPVDRVVIGAQDGKRPAAPQPGGLFGRQNLPIFREKGNRRVGQRQVDRNCRATPWLAINTDLPPHCIDQHLDDAHAQSGATKTPRGIGAGLLERNKERGKLFLRHTYSGIGHLYAHRAIRLTHQPDPDFAFSGEFQRIAQDIVQDLVQPHRIAHHKRHRIRRDIQGQRHILAGC